MSNEDVTQQQIRLALARAGITAFRNNVGACFDDTGRLIRYGLANDTPAMNKRIKSSDLICVIPVTVTPDMIGRRMGVFGAIECKPQGWKYTGKGREPAQAQFGQLIIDNGGRFTFATSPDDLKGVIL